MDRKIKLPIGIENFKEIRTEGFYYVDKTGLIRELLHNWGKVNLFTRPRRFGKSLNMSMLKHFFEIDCDRSLFDGLEISEETELCDAYMGKFPVISISLKGVSGSQFEAARAMMCSVIAREALRFQFLLESDKLSEFEKQQYVSLVQRDENGFSMTDADLMNSLLTLSVLLEKHFAHKVIVLIDEYDVPLDKAMQADYYEDMVNLLRNFLGEALKSNDSIYFAVLTGCLRVAKESIFTGLNNFNVLSITTAQFDEYFGFTDSEVRELLEYYDLYGTYDTVKKWYDGYRFGNVDVYCPWDVINYCYDVLANPRLKPKTYWMNTSGNAFVKTLIQRAPRGTEQMQIEKLIAGEPIRKIINEQLTHCITHAVEDGDMETLEEFKKAISKYM